MRLSTADYSILDRGAAPAKRRRYRFLVRRPMLYSRTAMALHWIVALAVLAQLALGWWMLDIPKSPPGLRAGWFNIHKSIGLTIGMLVLARLAWRWFHPPPPLPQWLPAWQRFAARFNHLGLYVCLVAMPLTGYLGSTFSPYPVRYFGVLLPAWNIDSPAAKELMSAFHYGIVSIFMALIGMHIAAAAWHWLHRDGIVTRMGIRQSSQPADGTTPRRADWLEPGRGMSRGTDRGTDRGRNRGTDHQGALS